MKAGMFLIFWMVFRLFSLDADARETDVPIWQVEEETEEEAALLQQQLLDELDLQEADAALQEIFGEERVSLKAYVLSLIKGEIPLDLEELGLIIRENVIGALTQQQKTAAYVLALVVISCAFANFANVFEKSQVSEVTFYMMYFLLFTILIRVFYGLSELTQETVEKMLTFMKVLMPTYLAAAVLAGGSVSGAAFYELILGFIGLMQWLLRYGVIPAANLYMICTLLNQLSKEDYLSRMSELLKGLVDWALKTMAAVVIGLQAVQNLILPAVDSLKKTLLQKAGGSLPGVGNLFNSVTEVLFGSAVLIKNAVGVAGLILLLVICAAPLVRLGTCSVLYRLIGAVLQPVADKRMTECVGGIGEGALLLFKVVATTGALFFISLAMAVAAVKGG
ncbi:MAG: stage III sporulation protein AE [Eubacteriales bacterium]|nr:stage III sporulation protein AE [Eubacteriales bacterium]